MRLGWLPYEADLTAKKIRWWRLLLPERIEPSRDRSLNHHRLADDLELCVSLFDFVQFGTIASLPPLAGERIAIPKFVEVQRIGRHRMFMR